MTKLAAVIFDMDGTLLDSREFIYRAMEEVLANHGVAVTREQIGEVTGKPIKAMYSLLAAHLDPDELEIAHFAHHEQNLDLLKLYDGTEETIQAIKNLGLKVCIFTGFNQLTYDRLDRFGITGLFDTIVETTRYSAHKPDPEGLFVAMKDLALDDPRSVIYVGDGITDMQVGVAAKVLSTVGITHGFSTREVLEKHGADQVVDGIPELLPIVQKYL